MHIYMYTCIHIYIYTYIHIYIYTHITELAEGVEYDNFSCTGSCFVVFSVTATLILYGCSPHFTILENNCRVTQLGSQANPPPMTAKGRGVHYIMSYHIISYQIRSDQIVSCHVMSYHIISYHVTSCHIMSYNIIQYRTVSERGRKDAAGLRS